MMEKVRVIARDYGGLPHSSLTSDGTMPWTHPGLGPQKSLHRIPTAPLGLAW